MRTLAIVCPINHVVQGALSKLYEITSNQDIDRLVSSGSYYKAMSIDLILRMVEESIKVGK